MEKYKTLNENKQDLNQFFEDKVTNVIKQFPNTHDFKLPVSGFIADLNLSVRALNSLKQGGIVTMEDLFSLSSSDMTNLNFSSRTINEISEYKTIHQNKQDLGQFYLSDKEKDFNIGTVEEFKNKKPHNFKDRVGEVFTSTQGETVIIIEYFNNQNCTILFKGSNHIVFKLKYSSISKGLVFNPLYKSIYNIGYIGIGKYKTIDESSKKTKCYAAWNSMIDRCYNEKYQEKRPSYKSCSVTKEWHNFQNFAKWYNKNYMSGWHLDKDILIKGNKIYSPKTCCFVPAEINSFVLKCDKIRGEFPIGVSKELNNFRVSIRINNKTVHFGKFTTVEQAFNCYKLNKELEFKRVADLWKDQITEQTYKALINYKVEITD